MTCQLCGGPRGSWMGWCRKCEIAMEAEFSRSLEKEAERELRRMSERIFDQFGQHDYGDPHDYGDAQVTK